MSGTGPVGYYVHHHGAGHRALASAAARELGPRLVGLGSGGPPPGWPGPWVPLPRDDVPAPALDPTAAGAWHWAPTGHPGFSARMGTIARWAHEARPAALVVDVSCEVTALGTLLGVPTLPVMMHGRRDDRPHRTAWDGAAGILAPWPAEHAEDWQRPWAEVTTHLGLTSRFDDRPAPSPATGAAVVVLLPAGAHSVAPVDVDAAARATAADGWAWTVLGGEARPTPTAGGARWLGLVDDPWPHLGRARVVVAACGLGSAADIAAARRPAVLLPQPRPFDEQAALARHLARTAPVVVRPEWPEASSWPDLLDAAAGLDGDAWSALHDRRGGARLAAAVARAGR